MSSFMESDIERATVQVEMKDGRIYTFEVDEPRSAEVDVSPHEPFEPDGTPIQVGYRDLRLVIKPGREPFNLTVNRR
jgi:hypothetical protein